MMQKNNYYLAIRNYGEGRKERMVKETGRKKTSREETGKDRQEIERDRDRNRLKFKLKRQPSLKTEWLTLKGK